MLLGNTWNKGHPKGVSYVALEKFSIKEGQDPVDAPWGTKGPIFRVGESRRSRSPEVSYCLILGNTF